MPVSTGSCIFFTLPLWATFMAFVFLKEKISKYDLVQLIVSFIGVVLINNPFGESNNSVYSKMDLFVGSSFALFGAVCGSCAVLCMRYMNKGIHYALSPFWYACGCTIMAPIGHSLMSTNSSKYAETQSTQYDLYAVILISLCSIVSFFG